MNTALLRMFCLSIAALVTTGCGGDRSVTPSPAPAPMNATAVTGTVQSIDIQAKTLIVGGGTGIQTNLRSNEQTVLNS